MPIRSPRWMRRSKLRMIARWFSPEPKLLETFSATITDLVLTSSLASFSFAVPPGEIIAARWARIS